MNSPPRHIPRTLTTPAHLLKALLEPLREPLEPFRAARQRAFAGIAAHVVQKCICRYGRWAAQWAGAVLVTVGEDLFSRWEVVRVDTVEDIDAVGIFDCELCCALAWRNIWSGYGLLTCTNLISVGRMRNSLKALARKLRNSKYFFRI
jgi:hypothetical protein